MVIDLIVLGAVLLFTLHGYLKGFLRKLAGIASIIVACLAMSFVAERAASFAADQWGLNPVIIYIPCCIVGWVVTYIVARLVFGFIALQLGSGAGDRPQSWNRQLGAVFGALEGLAICWFLLGLVDTLPEDWRKTHLTWLHERMKVSPFARLTHRYNPASMLALRELIDDLRVVSKHPDVLERLGRDPAVEDFLRHEKVRAVMEDEQLLHKWQEGEFGGFLRDEKVIAALEDPEVREMLRPGKLREALHEAAEEARAREKPEADE